MPDSEDVVTHARERRVVVIGAGVAGLVAAWECARVGLTVTVLDAADRSGGSLAPVEIDGLTLDAAHIDIAPGDPEAEAVLHLLGCDTVSVPDARIALAGGGPLPGDELLGIPVNPWAPEVRRIIGWSGTWRAYLDRLRPPLTIGREPRLGALVRTRLGERVADRLVTPLAAARWETTPDDLDADAVLPGISTALTRTGSLTGAVSQLQAHPEPARRALRSGFASLVAALDTHLRDLSVEVHTGREATGITARDEGWRVTTDDADIHADAVIIATGAADAGRLLEPVLGDVEALVAVDEVDVVTLVVDATDVAQGGPDVLVFPRGSEVYSATDVTARSPQVGPARRVIRVVLAASERDDAALAAVAAASVTDLVGASLTSSRVRGVARSRRVAAGTGRRVADSARREATRAMIDAHEGLDIVGGWLAGGDVADEIGDAVRTAERVRHGLLWGREPDLGTP